MKKICATIYCKIGTDNYPFFEKDNITGDEIVDHLLSDCGYAYLEDGKKIPGDLCVWYLGTNEKFGSIYLQIDNLEWDWQWGFGESNFDCVTKFVNIMKNKEIITNDQYQKLKEVIKIGKTIGDMYLIPHYLQTIKEGKKWIPRITTTKQNIRNMIGGVKQYFEEKGHNIYIPEGKQQRGPEFVTSK